MSNSAFSPIAAAELSYTEAGEPMYKVLRPWKGEPVWIDIVTDQPEMTPAQLESVNQELGWLWENPSLIDAQFREGSELLTEKNQNLFEDEEAYDTEAFAAQILLEAIQLTLKNGQPESLQLWYDDGELFGGASIMLEWKDRALSAIRIVD